MNKHEIEKSLKRFLKRRLSYTLSLLISFLITGGFAVASELNKEELLSRINEDRVKLEQMLKENQKKREELQKNQLELLKEADFYVKPEKASLFSMLYFNKNMKNVNIEWQGSDRNATDHDSERDKFNSLQKGDNQLSEAGRYGLRSSKLSSGWVNKNTNYGNNANAYDVESKLFILPVVKAPVVNTPTAPNVTFTPPTAQQELKIVTPAKINIQMGTITVTAPTVTAPTVTVPSTITAPTLASVTVNEPNVAINIGNINVAGPTGLTLPSLTPPTVNVTTSVLIPEGIKTPELNVNPPESPAAPNFEVFSRGRGSRWLAGSWGSKSNTTYSSYNEGFNNFDPLVTMDSGVPGQLKDFINEAPMFSLSGDIYGTGTTTSEIVATSNGTTVDNHYKNIASTTATQNLWGSDAYTLRATPGATITYSPHSFPGVAAGTLVSNTDNRTHRYQHTWIFQGSPAVVRDMTITIGGARPAGTTIFAQTTKANLRNVDINLKGYAQVANLESEEDHSLSLNAVNINMENKKNTLVSISSVTINAHGYDNQDHRNTTSGWGGYRGDRGTGASTGINLGTTNLTIKSQESALYYIRHTDTHRWWGSNYLYSASAAANAQKYEINPGKYRMYYPSPGNTTFKNEGTIQFIGDGNVGAWIANYAPNRAQIKQYNGTTLQNIAGAVKPTLKLGSIVKMQGDNNTAYYFASHPNMPNHNGVFEGDVKVNVEIGTSLGTGGTTQNIGDSTGNPNKSEKNVAVFVASGQRSEMTTKVLNGFNQYYPASLSSKITNIDLYSGRVGDRNGDGVVDTSDYRIWGINTSSTNPVLNNIGAYQLGENGNVYATVNDFDLSDFNVKFGKYSKNGIGVVAKNGTVINLGKNTTISDNADLGAEDNIMVYAEGVWFNPRLKWSSQPIDAGTYGEEAYRRGESVTGQQNISDFNTTVKLKQGITMGSIKSTALFAKDGAKIDGSGKDITMSGYGSKAVIAYGVKNYSDIVDSNNANANKQPSTTVNVANIIAKANGPVPDNINTNIAAIAISQEGAQKGKGDVQVNVSGKVDVYGVGAYAKGDKATVTIGATNSYILTGSNSGLVATDGGTINFGGGTIDHKIDKQVPFYSANGSKLNFNGATTVNMYKGVAFHGATSDFTAGSGTSLYNGMSNVTVELKDNGVNLGVFKGANLSWKGNTDTTYVNGIKNIPHVHAINTGNYWYSSSLENGTLTVETDVDRDSISSGATRGDGFNDIQMERERVILQGGKTIKSLAGRGLILASNKDATKNSESGYTLKKGTVDISNGANPTTGVYVNFGHIVTEKTATDEGIIKVSKGVAAYGVNGSKIQNEGTVKVVSSDTTNPGVGIMLLAKTDGKTETYGIANNKAVAGSKWMEIVNKGTIDITGTNAIGIYAKNNHTAAATRALSTIYNEAPIELGDQGKAIVVQTTNTEGATLTLKDSGRTTTSQDIKVGKEGIGVYAEYSDVKFDGNYGIVIEDDGIAVQAKGVGKIEKTGATDKLNVEYKGVATKTAMALAYTGVLNTDTFTNDINLNLTNTGNAKTLVGIYASGLGTLTNNGDITVENDGTYGILSKGVDIVNAGTIKVGKTTSTDSDALGIYVENAKLTTDGDKLKVQGNGGTNNKPIGIYVKENVATVNKDITINQGTDSMKVDGKKSLGLYLDGNNGDKLKLINKSDIELTASATSTDKRTGLVLKNAKNTGNITTGKIIVKKNNIGIYNENSILTHQGTLEVKHDEDTTTNIGIHNNANGGNFVFKVEKTPLNPGLVDVEGRDGTVGISAETDGTNTGTITLTDAQIKVKATNMGAGKIPLGIYAKGNKININSTSSGSTFTVSPNAVGIYLEGDNTSKVSGSHKYSLSSENTADRLGIGTYFKGGSYATTTTSEKIAIESTQTKANSDGPIRPIGLFYGQGSTKNEANLEILSTSNEVIGMYGKNLTLTNTGKIDVGAKGIGAYFAETDLTNKGEVNVTAAGAYGLYLNGGTSNTQAKITVSGKDAVGVLVTGKNATFENKAPNSIISKGDNSIAVYVEKDAEFTNSGKVTSEEVSSKSIGVFADKGKVTNALNATIESKNVGIYAKTSSTVNNSGKINIVDGSGIVATDKTTVNLNASGLINSTATKANGVIATNKTTVNLSGTNISLTGNKSTAIYSDNKSTVNLTSGDVTIGQEGLGLYTNNGTVDLTSYTGTFSLGNKSVGLYSKASTVNGGTLKVTYNNADTGVGIFYDGGTVTNNTVVQHTGKNLVNILSKGVTLTNTADQDIQESSIGVYAVGGEVTNSGTMTLTGDKSVAFYLDNGAKLKAIGTINGTVAANYKVGIYAKDGKVEGTGTYNFAVDNGVAMYLDNDGINDFKGTLNMSANSLAGKRAVGIYTTPSTTARNIDTNINVTGKDSIGMLLSGNATTGSTVNYGGTLDISAASSNKYGIGAMVQQNSVFNLTSTGKVKIGGTNNIGFYVKQGGTLQVTGGTVENTKDGTFAYLENGNLEFKAGTVPNINYLNVSVSGTSGLIKNSTSIAVGTSGLQATDGAKILNTSTGTINGKVDSAKALVGIGAGTNIVNQGSIKLEGKESVAMYVNDNAIGTSTGSVEVGKNSVAYFVKDNGLINVSGTTKIGKDSSVFYINKGSINYTGKDIVLPDSTTGVTLIETNPGATAIDFNGKSITVGENATGIYITGQAAVGSNTIQNLQKINVGKLGNGIYINNNNPFSTNTTLEISGEEGIGIYSTKDGNLTYGGKIDSTVTKAKGIVHTGAGDTINNGVIQLTGDSSIGAYAKGGNLLENTNKIEIAKGTTSATAVGLYGLNQTTVKNSGNIKILESSIGIYGENTSVINTGSISNSGKNNNGIYAKNSDVTNTGPITLGDSSNGIFATSTGVKTITNSGNITVGNINSAGIFGAGKTGINNLGGNITIGKESVALATKEGNITVASATNFNAGESSTYIYSQKGNVVNNANLSLSDYSVGAYTETGNIQNNATITVGKSLVGGSVNKVSVGMATEKGTITNNSTINVPDKYGVGMVATKGGTAINAVGATINANGELSYGMQATDSSNLINNGTINVRGKDARGMAATNNSKILNTGTITIDSSATKAQGIYVDFGSEVENSGVINLNSTTGVGILAGAGGVIKNNNTGTINLGPGVSPAQKSKVEGASQLSAGAITIKGPKAYIDNIEIQNSGIINVNGPLDLGTIKLGSAAGHIGTINAESFNNGKFIVLPNATLGSNKDMYTIQYLGGIQNVPNNGSITAISYSATFVADIQKDTTSHNVTRIVLVRIPYTKLLSGTPAENFGKGLEDLYKGLSQKGPEDPEQKIFDALKMISDKDQLGATFDMELRGNTYANVQGRILDINENFSNSYENLKNSNLYARGRFKTGAIITSGNAKDKNPAVEDYSSKTTGLIIMKEKDFVTYGRSADVSLAFTETNFKFDYGSKEKVHSLQLGAGFENYMKDNNWKYSTRGEFTINKHNMKRKIHLSNGTYENKGKYWSETVEWKNKLRYEIGSSHGLVTVGIFGTFNLGYGKFHNIKENGDGAELEIKSKDMFMLRPGIGADIAFNHYTKGGKISLMGVATAEYEAGKIYNGVNQAKIKNSNAGYYDLEKPKQIKEVYKVGAQIQYETNAGHKIGVGITREAGSVNATKVGINAVYKF
jgi:outer membrane protein